MNAVLAEFAGSGISILNGKYGAYIKYDGRNYRIPKGTDASRLGEAECKAIIEGSQPTSRPKRRYPRK